MCYAYRGRGVEEPLIQHMMDAVSVCRDRWEFQALARKISRVLGLRCCEAESVLTLALLLHDVGKAAEIYQSQCGVECSDFRGHHMISLFLVNLAYRLASTAVDVEDMERFLDDDFSVLGSEEVKAVLVMMSAALHHYHQVVGLRRYSVEGSERATEFLRHNPRIYTSCVEGILLLPRMVQGLDDAGVRVLNRLGDAVANIGVYRAGDEYRKSLIVVENFYKRVVEYSLKNLSVTLSRVLVESAVGLTNMCDGLAASRARRGGRG